MTLDHQLPHTAASPCLQGGSQVDKEGDKGMGRQGQEDKDKRTRTRGQGWGDDKGNDKETMMGEQ